MITINVLPDSEKYKLFVEDVVENTEIKCHELEKIATGQFKCAVKNSGLSVPLTCAEIQLWCCGNYENCIVYQEIKSSAH